MLSTFNIDIVALSETKFSGSGQLKEHDYTFFWSGVPEEEHLASGVGFAIKNSLSNELSEIPVAVDERLMTLRIPLPKSSGLFIISAYAPTMTNSEEIKDRFYENLRKILLKVSPKDSILLLGDFNARVGSDSKIWPNVIGNHLRGKINSNGIRLLSLCTEFSLTITNSIFQQRDQFKGTWRHPRAKQWHTLDYVIVRQKDRNSVNLTRAERGTECWSDHRLVRSQLKVCIPRKKRRSKCEIPKKINLAGLSTPHIASEFSSSLDKALEGCSISEDIESSWKSFKDTVYNTSVELLGFPKRKNQDWFNENDADTKQLIEQLHQAHAKYMANRKSRKAKSNYFSAKRTTQGRLRTLKEQWWKQKADELQLAADTRNTAAFYQGLKAVYGPKTKYTSPLLSSDGKTLLVEEEKILDRWVEHFSDVLNRPSSVNLDIINSLPQREEISEIDIPPTVAEVKAAAKKLCRGKQPELGGIPPDIYKIGGPRLLRKLTQLLANIWKKGEVPQQYKDASIVSLFKRGKRSLCDNYRGISLLCVAGKILARVIINRINTHMTDNVCSESQCGFRKGRGTVDMIFSLRQIQEKSREHRTPLYMAFIDLTKAFDTVSRTALWIILEKLGIPKQMLKIIISFHDGMLAQVMHGGKISESFAVKNGTKQGCVLAPLLFALYFAVMLDHALKGRCFGVPISFRTTGGLFNIRRFTFPTKTSLQLVCDLLFADDCALVSQSAEELQEVVNCFAEACTDFGLTISTKKTEIVYQPPPYCDESQKQPPIIKVHNTPLKVVQKFCYLGSEISEKATLDEEIKLRISKASQAFGKLEKRLWSSHDISLQTKIMVYRATIITALTYGSESWTPYRRQIKTLDAFHMRKLRSICGISWKDMVTNQEVLSRCAISGIETFLMKSQLRWTGHVIRMNENRLPKTLMYGQIANAKRPEGRPLLRYKDKLKANLSSLKISSSSSWEQLATERNDWRNLCNQHVTHFEEERKQKMIKSRQERKAPHTSSTSNSQFICDICSKVCKSKAGLVSHKKSHPTTDMTQPAEDQRTCEVCNKVCKNKHGLMVHKRVHNR